MPHDYYMSACPACGGSHNFTAKHGVPWFDRNAGASFDVTCPESGKQVEVSIPADEPTPAPKVTDLLCTTCTKAYYHVKSEQKRGGTAVMQRLECANPGCQHQHFRVINAKTGETIL